DTLHYRACAQNLNLLERELVGLTPRHLLQEASPIIDGFAVGAQEGELGCEDAREKIAIPGVLRLVDASVERTQDLILCHWSSDLRTPTIPCRSAMNTKLSWRVGAALQRK